MKLVFQTVLVNPGLGLGLEFDREVRFVRRDHLDFLIRTQ